MIAITCANGRLGRLIIEGLKAKIPANQIVAAARSPEKAADLGVEVRKADYDDPDSLRSALAGADKVLLISSMDFGRRVPQHEAVVRAALYNGVKHILYTSTAQADNPELVLTPEHKATEAVILASGLTYTFLRHSSYHESFYGSVNKALATGGFSGSAGDGRIASAARADFAAAAVAALTGAGHENKIYELSGDTSWTQNDLAAAIGKAAGKEITYTNLTPEQHRAALVEAGMPEPLIGVSVAFDGNTRDGMLSDVTSDLHNLIGRPTTPLADVIAQLVRAA